MSDPTASSVSLISKGRLLSFSEAIDIMAERSFPECWQKPISYNRARRLPQSCSEADPDEQYYAANIILRRDPDYVLCEIDDSDESIPSCIRNAGPYLDIGQDLWDYAKSVANEGFARELELHKILSKTLHEFAHFVHIGKIVVRALDKDNGQNDDIYSAHWIVEDEELRARYSSGYIIARDGQRMRQLKIVVDLDGLNAVIPSSQINFQEREIDVRRKLQMAKAENDIRPPHGSVAILYKKISDRLKCNLKRAEIIVQEETGGCWSKKGRPKINDQCRANSVIVVSDAA